MSVSNISNNSLVSDLNWYVKSFKSEDPVIDIINYFNSESSSNGVIIQKDSSCRLLSRETCNKMIPCSRGIKFREVTIDNFFSKTMGDSTLVVPYDMPVSNAVYLAIQRKEQFRYDPLIIRLPDNHYGIVDFQSLLLALLKSLSISENQLKEITEFKKNIVRILTYDLRSVLNSIQGFAWIIEEECCSKEEAKQYAAFIKNAARQINTLLLKMLHSFSEETTEIRVYKTRFDMHAMLKEIIYSYGSEIISKRQQLSLKVKNESLKKDVFADKSGMFIVLETLISNAIKYSHIGGKILIAISYLQDMIRISIKDNGQGMTKADLQKLFRKNAHLSSHPTAGELSTGLDLYISKKILDLHNGKITVISEPGIGSVFTIEIPACEE